MFRRPDMKRNARSTVWTKGKASQAAEKLNVLKGTAFRPYITPFVMNSALAAEGCLSLETSSFQQLV